MLLIYTPWKQKTFSGGIDQQQRALTHFMPLVYFNTPWNLWFSNVLKGYQKKPVAWNGLIPSILNELLKFLEINTLEIRKQGLLVHIL